MADPVFLCRISVDNTSLDRINDRYALRLYPIALGRVVSRASRGSLEAKHGALCETVVEALQYNTIDATDLYFNIMQATMLGG